MYHRGQKERSDKVPPLSEARKRAKSKYNEKVTRVTIEFYPHEADLVQKVNEQPSKQAYIKSLIRKDIK